MATVDRSPTVPRDCDDGVFRRPKRVPFKRKAKEEDDKSSSSDDSSASSNNSSSSSGSSSSSSASSSSNGSSIEIPCVKKSKEPTRTEVQSSQSVVEVVRVNKARKATTTLESSESLSNPDPSVQEHRSPTNVSQSATAVGNASNYGASPNSPADEFAIFDDDFPWFDEETDPSYKPSDLPETVVIDTTANASKSSAQDKVKDSNGNASTLIGPIYHSERKAEVQPSFYAPPMYCDKQPPIVHQLSLKNRPQHMRQTIPVSQIFKTSLSILWKSKFDKFNHLQSELSSVLVNTNDTVVVSAPTGAGKTAVFEMAMARHINVDLEVLRQSSDWHQKQLPSCRKIVYIAPSKALCEERYEDWSRRFSDLRLGIRTAMVTGDAEPGDTFRDIASSHLILTTPEKWDSLTRRWTENFVLIASVKLILVDEVHLLGDPSRGSCLESVLCRMKTIFRATQSFAVSEDQIRTSSYSNTTPNALSSYLRIVAVSATLPNIGDIAAFLDANEAFAFDSSYRPVPLTTHVAVCGEAGKNAFMFAKNMSHKVPGVIRQFSKGKPTIVFCHTKKDTETLAMELAKADGIGFATDNHTLAGQTSLSVLQRCLLRGVAYHNAGLDAANRKLVEKGFLEGKIKCLCATSTLAVGVNLPAHLVVIKGTTAWRGSEAGYQDIEKGSLLQMIGRAGRAGFDTSGTAVIMTDSRSEHKYKDIGSSLEIVESQLQEKLVQVMNTAISQKVITTFQSAKNWLATTFLFQRIKRSPNAYGVNHPAELDQCLTRICGAELKKLDDIGVVAVSKHQNGDVTPLFGSHIMSQHLVQFSAMKLIINLPFDSDTHQILASMSQFDGLHKPVRRSEKRFLNEVHKAIRYKLDGPPSKVRVQEPHQKAFVLLQAAIGQHFLDDFTLRQEMSSMVEFSTRALSATEDFSLYGSKNGQVALQSLRLRRSLAVSLWGSSDGVLNQLRGVGQETTSRLRSSKITSFLDVLNAKEEVIEKAARRTSPFGSELRKAVWVILRNSLKITASVSNLEDSNAGRWVVCNTIRNDKIPSDAFSDSTSQSVSTKYTLIAYTDQPNGCLFFRSNVEAQEEFRFRCPDKFGKIWVHLVSNLVGLDESVAVEGDEDLVAASLFTSNQANATQHKKDVKNSGVGGSPGECGTAPQQKKRIRDPGNPLKDGFKRQAKQSKKKKGSAVELVKKATYHGQKQPPTAVTPSSVPPPELRQQSHLLARKGAPSPTTLTEVSRDSSATSGRNWNHGETPSGSCTQGPRSGQHARRGCPDDSRAPASGHRTPRDHDSRRNRGDGRSIGSSRSNRVMAHHVAPVSASPKIDSTWRNQKREQRSLQQSAFTKQKENPFAKFQYDPNDAENNLDAITNENSSRSANGGSILPPEAFNTVRQRRTNLFQKGPTRMRSKKGNPRARPGMGSNSQSMPSHMVLRMKAEEEMRYMGEHPTYQYPMEGNQYPPASSNAVMPQHQMYPTQETNAFNHTPHRPGSCFRMIASQSVTPHKEVWAGTQPSQLHYQPAMPQQANHSLPQRGSLYFDGGSTGDSWQHHQSDQRCYIYPKSQPFIPQQGAQEWGNPHDFSQAVMPAQPMGQAGQLCYRSGPDYEGQPSHQLGDDLLESGFF